MTRPRQLSINNLPCLLAIIYFSSFAFTASANTRIALHPQATITGSYIKLHDIAAISGEASSEMSRITISPAPTTGEQIILRRDRIKARLLAFGYQEKQLFFAGAKQVQIKRTTLTPSSFAKAELVATQNLRPELNSARFKKTISIKELNKLELREQVLKHIKESIAKLPKQDNLQVKVDLLRLNAKAVKASAIAKIVLEHNPGIKLNQTTKLEFVAYDHKAARIGTFTAYLKVQAKYNLPTPRLKVNRGKILTSKMLETKWISTKNPKQYCQSLSRLIGKRVKQTLQVGKPIRNSAIGITPLVKRGQIVQVIAKRGAFKVIQYAVALKQGGANEIIPVRNTKSGKQFLSKVQSDGTLNLVTF